MSNQQETEDIKLSKRLLRDFKSRTNLFKLTLACSRKARKEKFKNLLVKIKSKHLFFFPLKLRQGLLAHG